MCAPESGAETGGALISGVRQDFSDDGLARERVG
jgi:hypothetical protein